VNPNPNEVLLLELRECAVCKNPVVYYDGDFRHLTSQCPEGPPV
jgi:hypothetical protein